MDVLEAVENETLESHSRSRGFECCAIRAHKNESKGSFFAGKSASDSPVPSKVSIAHRSVGRERRAHLPWRAVPGKQRQPCKGLERAVHIGEDTRYARVLSRPQKTGDFA